MKRREILPIFCLYFQGSMLLIFWRPAGVGKGTMSHASPVEKQCHSIISKTKLWTRIFLFAIVCTLISALDFNYILPTATMKSPSFRKCPLLQANCTGIHLWQSIKNSLGQLPLFSVTWSKLLQREKEKQCDILKEHSNQTQKPKPSSFLPVPPLRLPFTLGFFSYWV